MAEGNQVHSFWIYCYFFTSIHSFMLINRKLIYHLRLTFIQILFTRLGNRIYKNLLRKDICIAIQVTSFTYTHNNSLLLKTFSLHLNMDSCLKLALLIMKKIELRSMNSLEKIKKQIVQSLLTFKTLMLVLSSWPTQKFQPLMN